MRILLSFVSIKMLSLSLIGVGGWQLYFARHYTDVISENGPYVTAVFLIVCGILLFIAAEAGIVSACNRDRGCLITVSDCPHSQ